ncbi:MAG: hypothetical protein WC622_03685 [Pedobacter sp.]|jgi:ankyrin repeat protein|uniref:hypothetical protein n=1 Tax=Pedobacter sp. TaxID=1411316 RepID=UPI003567686B
MEKILRNNIQSIQDKGTVWKMLLMLLAFDLVALVIHVVFFIKGSSFMLNEEMYPKLSFFFVALGIIILSMVILKFGNDKALILGCTFSAVPLVFTFALMIAKLDLVVKREESQALHYYHTSTQQDIALAIEYNNVELLSELIAKAKEADKLSSDENQYSYLQFAIDMNCSNGKLKNSFEKILRVLLESGIHANDALIADYDCLSPESVVLLLDFGMNPNRNIRGKDPLIFDMIGKGEKENAIVLLLIRSGADIDVRNSKGQTPIMFAAQVAAAFPEKESNWNLVYKLLELRANFTCSAMDGSTLGNIIRAAKVNAARKKQSMPTIFFLVSKWMTDHHYADVPF